MRIEDLPRPWLLAAMTGVSMSDLLEQAERERAGQAEEARRNAWRDEYRRRLLVDRPALKRRDRPVEVRSLAS